MRKEGEEEAIIYPSPQVALHVLIYRYGNECLLRRLPQLLRRLARFANAKMIN